MSPDEARRVVAEEHYRQWRTDAPLAMYRPGWAEDSVRVGNVVHFLGAEHGPKLPWSEVRKRAAERRALALHLAGQGWKVPAIARHLGVSVTTARKYLAPPPPPPPPTPLWRLPRAKRLAERAKRRRLGMLAWAERSAAHAA